MEANGYAVRAVGLHKRYGEVRALDGFDLAVPTGLVYGLLGPNGAGKTTAVRVLTTLIRADGGRAEVAGYDVAARPRHVRHRIGLAGQHVALDDVLTGRQNLEMFGRLYHLGVTRAARRAAELLDQFDLTEAADKGVKEYSGGMRRRLDLAASMMLAPRVMFLDEPTTGLDPRGRNEVWASIRALVAGGTTVLLTTQYLDEADQLAGRIAVMDVGRVIADDTPAALKNMIGGDRIEVMVQRAADLPAAAKAVARAAEAEPHIDEDGGRVSAPVTDRVAALIEVVRALDEDKIAVADIGLRRPTLDDVFLKLTGHRAESTSDGKEASVR
jgi:ABC-2 type transport system ATP-binding protein